MISAGCGQAYATAGYFTLCPNFRGSAGFGEEFIRADERQIGFADYRDIIAGVEKVLQTFPVNRNRIGITG